MPNIDREGARIYYRAEGSGPAILLTHGFSATSAMWEPQVEALADRYRILRWDMRGHGRSSSPADPTAYTHEATVEDMTAVLDDAGVPSAVIGGLSLGGFMSLCFYLAHPERVCALVLCDTGPGYKKDEARASWNRYAEGFARRFEARGLAALGGSAEVQVARHEGVTGLIHAARGMLVQHDARVIEALPSIRVPTLLLVGSEDKPFLAGMEYMAGKIPGAVHVVIDGAGHAPNLEKPVAFNASLEAFLRGVAST
jgi:pimeloyl-ACP methyl ester carboxylesterase